MTCDQVLLFIIHPIIMTLHSELLVLLMLPASTDAIVKVSNSKTTVYSTVCRYLNLKFLKNLRDFEIFDATLFSSKPN